MLDSSVNTFITVVENGSFNKASEILYISPTAVMKQINHLEEKIGFKLFLRTHQGLQLTSSGKIYYQEMLLAQQFVSNVIAKASHASLSTTHIIRIGDSILRPCKPLIDFWKTIDHTINDFKIKLVPFNDDSASLDKIFHSFGKDFDIMYGVCDITLWKNYFNSLEICRKTFCIAVPLNHPLALRSRLTLKDLYGENLLLINYGISAIIDEIRLMLIRNHPLIHIESTPMHYDINLFNYCVEKDLLMLTVDGWQNLHPSLKTIPIDLDYSIPFGVMYPLSPSNDILLFLDIIQNYLGIA